jgi:hypothetical protein
MMTALCYTTVRQAVDGPELVVKTLLKNLDLVLRW